MLFKKACEYESFIEGIPVTIRKGRARILRIYVYPSGKTVVSAPHSVQDAVIYAFVKQKAGWINRKRAEFAALSVAEKEKTANAFRSGEPFYFLGERYELAVKEGKRFGLEILGKEAIFTVPFGATLSDKTRAVNGWYKEKLIKVLEPMIGDCERLTGLYASGFNLRNMRTRWGSCNVKTKKITFNLQLAKTPVKLIEYVVLHEILHIKVPNHGAEFQRLITEYMPDRKARKKELNEAGRIYAHI